MVLSWRMLLIDQMNVSGFIWSNTTVISRPLETEGALRVFLSNKFNMNQHSLQAIYLLWKYFGLLVQRFQRSSIFDIFWLMRNGPVPYSTMKTSRPFFALSCLMKLATPHNISNKVKNTLSNLSHCNKVACSNKNNVNSMASFGDKLRSCCTTWLLINSIRNNDVCFRMCSHCVCFSIKLTDCERKLAKSDI